MSDWCQSIWDCFHCVCVCVEKSIIQKQSNEYIGSQDQPCHALLCLSPAVLVPKHAIAITAESSGLHKGRDEGQGRADDLKVKFSN